MIEKRVQVGSWDAMRGDSMMALVEPVGGRFHKEAFLDKSAGLFDAIVSDLKPEKGRAYIHVISTGGLEKYGSNSNGDSFNLKSREFTLPHPKEGSAKVLTLGGGLLEHHDKTFMKEGAVYRNHKNGLKGGKPCGMVKAAMVNKGMERGELLLDVDADDMSKELQKLASGDNLFLSMGCLVETDTCSYCGNKASNRSKYCQHLKEAMCEMDKEGHAVHAINDVPIFHDISVVARPADRIACGLDVINFDGMSKCGSAEVLAPVKGGGYAPLAASFKEASSALSKLADMEKKVTAVAEPSCGAGPKELPKGVLSEMSEFPLEDVLSSLSSHKCMLDPKSLFSLLLGPRAKDAEDDVDGVAELLPGLYSKLDGLPFHERREFLEDGSYEPSGKNSARIEITIRKIIPACSMEPEAMADRASARVIEGGDDKECPHSKKASRGSGLLAREYARYQLSFLGRFPKEGELAAVAVANMAR